ncbi:MAG: 2-C-methyl-D-erythritol 2,4-cyclodiphosphate synthase [Planctomycetaceae bacterium]|jgi:2-C-methyl-D-erythritol 2,4-cyclodiphosphate synthase|nr:2-C-methyl-D-erythritol 2,4-cyclodiphosphate synthase [Planctomycetaceae bacterium]
MFRIGIGHDTHRLVEGSVLLLGGVRIEHTRKLLGHSDADVLLHAVTDALLGAAGLSDIGEMFPDTDEANKERDSAEMLRIAYQKVRANGWTIVNLDMIIFAQKPKMAPYKEAICRRIADVLQIETHQIGIKAKTGEYVGTIGREEAVSAQCVCLLERV